MISLMVGGLMDIGDLLDSGQKNPTARKNLTTVLNTSWTAMDVIIVHLAQTQTNLIALEFNISSYEWESETSFKEEFASLEFINSATLHRFVIGPSQNEVILKMKIINLIFAHHRQNSRSPTRSSPRSRSSSCRSRISVMISCWLDSRCVLVNNWSTTLCCTCTESSEIMPP